MLLCQDCQGKSFLLSMLLFLLFLSAQASMPSVPIFRFCIGMFYIKRLETKCLLAFTFQSRFPCTIEVNAPL